ncbi:MAG: sodium-coupled transporter, partial [Anaerolineae bacterium]|nr:sodium-coupled transporter [Anaerolineae bacterium]
SGFANPAVVTVVAIFVVSEGLFQTGVADYLGLRILRMSRARKSLLYIILMLTVGFLSAFINNVGATAVFMPAVLIIARRTKIRPSKLLMPLAFASAMGGNLTLIGTPPNLLASAILQNYQGCENFSFGCQGFGFFDFAPMGLLILGIGTLYMTFIGRWLLPGYDTHSELTENYHVRQYLSEIRVLPGSPLVGKTLIQSRFGEDYGLTIIGIIRDGQDRLAVRRNDLIQADDILLVEGSLDKILTVRTQQGLRIEPDMEHHDTDLKSHEAGIVEVIIDVGSGLAGQCLKEIRFREKYRLSVLALRRHGESISGSIGDEPLQPGDVLLVQGRRQHTALLRTNPNFLLLEPVPLETRRTDKAPLAVGVLGLALILATIGWIHISIAAVIVSLIMTMSGVLTVNEAYKSIDWQSVFLIGGMLPLGVAMETTNAAKFLADGIVETMAALGPLGIMIGLYLLAALMTQAMSNAATTVLLAPIAINIALDLGADPRSFLMAVVIAASASFLTPIAHQSNILVFGPGGYKFTDFVKVGFGLTVLYMLLVAFVLPLVWPLFP